MAGLTLLVAASSLVIYIIWKVATSFLRNRIPHGLKKLPGPKGYPIIGSVPDVPEKNGFIKFADWGKEYGPIYQVNLAGSNHVWISTDEVARDLLSKKGAIYSDRPHIPALLSDNRTSAQYLPLMSKNDGWSRQRKFANVIMRESENAKFHRYPELEAKRMLVELLDQPEYYNHALESFIARVTCRLAWGHSEASDELKQRARELLIGVSPTGALGNKLPFVMALPDWLSPAKSWERRRARTESKFFHIMQGQVESDLREKKASPSWMQHFLDNQKKWGFKYELEGAYAVGMHGIAGALTIAAPMQTFCLAMVHYPQYLPMLQEELDCVCGDRLPVAEDRPNLPFLRAVIRECLRWRPPVPTGIPHEVTQDDEYNGYFIPKGSVIHPLEWAIARDPRMFPDPEAFNPLRWIEPSYPTYQEPLTQYPTIINSTQFGYGRRTCQGQTVADEDLLIGIGSIAWLFNMEKKTEGSNLPSEPAVVTDPEKVERRRLGMNEQASISQEELNTETATILEKVTEKATETVQNASSKLDPTLDFSTLLIAKPLPFKFTLKPRDFERVEKVRKMYDEGREKGAYTDSRAYWGEQQGRAQTPKEDVYEEEKNVGSETTSPSRVQIAAYLFGVALFSISFLVFLNSSISFVITQRIGQSHNVGDAVGTLGFADELVALVACPIWGLLSDRVGVRTVVVLGYAIVGVSLYVFMAAKNVYPELLLARLLFSLGGTATATMVTAILPTMTVVKIVEDPRSPTRRTNGTAHAISPSPSELTITPARFQDDDENTLVEKDTVASTSHLAGLVGMFTGCGALVALLVFLPLPTKFQNGGANPATAVADAFYVVGIVAILVSIACFFGLRNLPGEEGKTWRRLVYRDSQKLTESASSRQRILSYPRLFWESVKLGISSPNIGLGYVGGFVARASSVAISLFIPLFTNTYFLKTGRCHPADPSDPADIKHNCADAYKLAAMLSGVSQLIALLCAPVFGYLSGRYRKYNLPLLIAAAAGIAGYSAFGSLTSPDPKSEDGSGAIFAIVALLGISQIGAIVCSLALLGRGINNDEPSPSHLRNNTPNSNDHPSAGATPPRSPGLTPASEEAPLLSDHSNSNSNTHLPSFAGTQNSHNHLKGAIAGTYSLLGGFGILLLTKAGGALFDSSGPGAPFYMMAAFNAILLVVGVGVGVSDAWRARSR
ncbi:cytochrome P450 [Massarina eburnea CBS 473.64]|uniref:Cytochrome P450 n=1 Tax=Massarina eburnea CBS 473.64 TaxID=1395130 RepID=A0A6A6S6E0_9PLEO|nr:cytochrome P450 [Massarina eburnea CBS 473.64]